MEYDAFENSLIGGIIFKLEGDSIILDVNETAR